MNESLLIIEMIKTNISLCFSRWNFDVRIKHIDQIVQTMSALFEKSNSRFYANFIQQSRGAIKKRKRPPFRIRLSVSNFIILDATSPLLAKTNKFIHFRMCATPFNYPHFSYVIESTYFHSTAPLSIRKMQIHFGLYTNR